MKKTDWMGSAITYDIRYGWKAAGCVTFVSIQKKAISGKLIVKDWLRDQVRAAPVQFHLRDNGYWPLHTR